MENERFQDLVLDHLARLTRDITELKQGNAGMRQEIVEIRHDITGLKQDNTAFRQDITELKQDNAGIKQDITELKQDSTRIKESLIRIENDHGEKLKALFDAREVQTDVNERICDTLNRIEAKVDRLTLKVSTHDALLKRAR